MKIKPETLNLRRKRSEAFASMILREIDDLIDPEKDYHIEAYNRIEKLMYDNGFCWTNDEERRMMGFEARDEFGWTLSERQRQQKAEAEMMLERIKPILFSLDTVFDKEDK